MKREKGSILIFTLWVLIILAILSIILSRRASSDIRLAKYESDSIKATYLSRAGVMKMIAEFVRDTNSYDSLDEDWNRDEDAPKEFSIRNDTVFYGASDDNRRLNLNGAGLKEVELMRLGMDETLAVNLLEYRKKKDKKVFEFTEELFLVEGMTRDIYTEIEDMVTIFRGDDSKININTADEKVLMAVLGDDMLVYEVLDYRRGPDGEEGTEDDGIFKDTADIEKIEGLDPALFSVTSDVFRIWARSFFGEERDVFRGVEAIAGRSGKIYHWKEY